MDITMDRAIRLVVAHAEPKTRQGIRDALDRAWSVVADCATAGEMERAAAEAEPDVLVTGTHFPDGDGIEAAIRIGRVRPVPTVIVTARRSLEMVERAMLDHVMAYLIEPVRPVDLQAAVVVAHSRFEQFRELHEQVGDLRRALEHRKVIERAKGILMAEDKIGEREAFARLRREAQDRRMKMVALAQEIVDRGEPDGAGAA